jgi:hypothetical protein
MAQSEVTGADETELLSLQREYEDSKKFKKTGIDFENAYCLTRIGKQPEEYDGLPRYCKNRAKRLDDGGHAPSCRFHGGRNNASGNNDNLSPLHRITHGMYATEEHLKEVFTEKDQKLYDWVMEWADVYGWPSKEEDPSRYDDLEAIAINRVRVARSHKYILDEGEMDRQEVYDENGNVTVVTDTHGLSEDVRLKRKLITDLKKELGLTVKEQSRMDSQETSASAAEQVAELATEAVFGDEDQGYDPDDAVFEED